MRRRVWRRVIPQTWKVRAHEKEGVEEGYTASMEGKADQQIIMSCRERNQYTLTLMSAFPSKPWPFLTSLYIDILFIYFYLHLQGPSEAEAWDIKQSSSSNKQQLELTGSEGGRYFWDLGLSFGP